VQAKAVHTADATTEAITGHSTDAVTRHVEVVASAR
jgi:hypothetical protein